MVTCFDVLQHLPDGGDRVAAEQEIARVLRPGGVVVVAVELGGFRGRGFRNSGGSAYRLGELVEVLT